MKIARLVFLSTMILTVTNLAAQNDTTKKEVIPDFKNQREQEDYWAKELFNENYTKQNFKRYPGKVMIANNNTFRYGDNILKVINTSENIKDIFRLGIIHSAIIGGGEDKKKLNADSLTQGQKTIYSLMRIDTLTVSDVEELKTLSNSCEVKRFRLLLWRIGIANPMLYFFELTNDKANKKTKLLDFIKGSNMTYIKMYSILM